MDSIDLIDHLRATLQRPGAAALTAVMAELITTGAIPPGQKLPPIRDVAAAVDASPSLVGLAWQSLRMRGIIETRTRGGSRVVGPPQPPHPRRFLALGSADADAIDLGRPAADPLLLPDLRAALRAVADTARDLNAAEPPPISPALQDAASAGWPFEPPRLLAVHRGIDGIEQTLLALTGPGQVVAVEDPTVPRVLDLLDRIGARVIPVAWRADGPDVRELARAGRAGASLFLYQPNGHSPTGLSITPEWIDRAGRVIQRTGMLAVELDGFPLLHRTALSLGSSLPDATVLVRGFNHSHGPDVQVAVLGGPAEIVDRIEQGVAYSHRWVSRVLQDALAWMLSDEIVTAAVARASAEYRARYDQNRAWFSARGLDTPAGSSAPCLWLPVADDVAVVDHLRESGVSVLAGRNFARRVGDRRHIHVNASFSLAATEPHFERIVEVAGEVADELRARRRSKITAAGRPSHSRPPSS